MDKGKFSQPRPYRDEERQIEEAFRQITGKEPVKKQVPVPEPVIPETSADTDSVLEEAIRLTSEHPPRQTSPEAFPPESGYFREDSFSFPTEQEKPLPEETAEEPLPFLETVMNFCYDNKKPILVGLCGIALVLLMAVIGIFAFGGSKKEDDRILQNVYLADIPVGGMTKNEAISAVKQATSHTYAATDMVVDLAGTELRLAPKKTGAKLDVKAAVNAAYSYGRTGTKEEQQRAQEESAYTDYIIGLLPYLHLDTDYIRKTLEASASGSGSTLTQASYGLEGKYPELGVEKFDENAAQTLVLTMGTPGVSFNADKVYDQILDAYSLNTFLVTVEDVEPAVEPDEVDLQAIYEEFYVEPVNSTIDRSTFEVIPGSYGYGFDLLSAQLMVDAAQYGEIVRIPMIFLPPEVLEADVLFRDVLGESRTPLTDNKNRNTNIRLAAEAMNGTVLQPGDTFSYNNCLGERTERKGYKPAPAYSGNELVDTIGGGICQGSSTLYLSALLADLEIVSRTNHGFPVSYMDYGMDATVNWGGPDLKIRNNTLYPIQIVAETSGNYLTIQILGTEQRDYYVKMEYEITATHKPQTEYQDFAYDNAEGYLDGDVIRKGVTGYSVKTYKLKYSREGNKLISRDYEASSRYTTINNLVARVAEPETTVPETTVPETTVPPTTVPETTAPPETTLPPATEAPETVPPTPETQAPPQESQSPIQETEAPLLSSDGADTQMQ